MIQLVDTGQLYIQYEDASPPGYRLGRNAWFDARSLAYMIENDPVAMFKSPLKSVLWAREIPILDQGDLGSCTGNAGTGVLGTMPAWPNAERVLDSTDAAKDEKFAVDLYSDSTRVDGYPGVYPPDDTGSSGLAVCKVLKTRKLIRKYVWARSALGLLRLLQNGPVLIGMPWYDAFFDPDSDGFIDSSLHWKSSGIAGGHELEIAGTELNQNDVYSSELIIPNSWGESWGQSGYCKMRLRTYEQLSGVDLKQYVL